MSKTVSGRMYDATATQGNVKISIMKEDKVLKVINEHNHATINLCEYLRDALSGDYVIARRPGIIVPCTGVTDGSGKIIELNNIGNGTAYVNVKNGNEIEDVDEDGNYNKTYCSTTLSFLIPSILIADEDIWGFRLYSKDVNRKLYAEVTLQEPISLERNINLKVDWTLLVSYQWEVVRG